MRSTREVHVAGSSIDWPVVWRENSRWLRTVLLARLRDPHAVDEVFQELALIVARKPDRWPDRNKVGPWLYRVAIRQVQVYRRKRSRGPARLDCTTSENWESHDSKAIEPIAWLMDREAENYVRLALDELGGQHREILMLRHAQNWTYRQIAEHLGLSMDKVVYRLGRARELLKSKLMSQCYDWTQGTTHE